MLKRYLYIIIIACLILLGIGIYSYLSAKEPNITITQGIYGKVTLKSGNCMPRLCKGLDCFFHKSSCKTYPYSSNISIREPAKYEDMTGIHLKNKTTLLKTVKSDSNGFYQIDLLPGTYGIFVEDFDGSEYCSSWDYQNKTCHVTIKEGVTEYNISINHVTY